ncbi:MAG: hypothetical protein PHX18_01435 [Candidatus Gastranaerophilales bacterium]|nr:hypothetical protein [Candidatus Gastranaerophilales bacterium]
MQALLENNPISFYKSEALKSEFEKLMERASEAEPTLKNKIENEIVAKGLKFVPEMIEHMQTSKGITRGLCAMCLIRIGVSCVSFIEEASILNNDFQWIANYLLNEIRI